LDATPEKVIRAERERRQAAGDDRVGEQEAEDAPGDRGDQADLDARLVSVKDVRVARFA